VIEVAARAGGIEGVDVHTLRHSAAVGWLEAGVHIKAVADMLGHSSISITGDIYGHTADDAARAAVDGWSGVLGLLAKRRCATRCATTPVGIGFRRIVQRY
jgi:integrase